MHIHTTLSLTLSLSLMLEFGRSLQGFGFIMPAGKEEGGDMGKGWAVCWLVGCMFGLSIV